MTPKPLRVALIGLGAMGRNHLRALAADPAIAVAAIADLDPEAVATAGSHAPDARLSVDPLGLLREVSVDAAIIAAPTRAHEELAVSALERGLPLLVEKPLAADAVSASRIVEAASRAGVPLQVGHVERFNPAMAALRERLEAGYLARIFEIEALRESPLPARISDVGVVRDLMVHDLDLVCAILGARPTSLVARTTRALLSDREDHAEALLGFESGATAHVRASWLSPEKRRSLRIVGNAGAFTVSLLERRLFFTRAEPDNAVLLDGFAPILPGETVEIPVAPGEPLRLEHEAFFAVVRSGARPAVSGEDGLWAVRLADAVLRAGAEPAPLAETA